MARRTGGRTGLIVGAVAVLVVLGIGWFVWRSMGEARAFNALVAEGQAALDQVRTARDEGRAHLAPGETHTYDVPFPLSGIHAPTWVRNGVYESPQAATELVHSLEHGNIVIYVDEPTPETMEILTDWAALFSDPWSGIVVVPAEQLDDAVVLTAWTHILRLDPFDPAAAAAFIDAYRGRGPENPVR